MKGRNQRHEALPGGFRGTQRAVSRAWAYWCILSCVGACSLALAQTHPLKYTHVHIQIFSCRHRSEVHARGLAWEGAQVCERPEL